MRRRVFVSVAQIVSQQLYWHPDAMCTIFLAAVLLATPVHAQTLSGPAEIIDGDSLSVSGILIRLFGIDAPE